MWQKYYAILMLLIKVGILFFYLCFVPFFISLVTFWQIDFFTEKSKEKQNSAYKEETYLWVWV